MRRMFGALSAAVFLAAVITSAQSPATSTAPFKLGTFAEGGRTYVGIVVNDALVADVEAALKATGQGSPAPRDMKDLLARYDQAMEQRLLAVAKAAAAQPRPAWVRDLSAVKVRPPVLPTTMLNAAVNYQEHADEMSRGSTQSDAPAAPKSESMPGMWERKPNDTRQNPYYFLKPSAAVIADGEAIELPPGRERIDWECELAVVIGKTAKRVPVDRAGEYIFGYTLENDVSDRGGRGDRRHGSDWLIGKGHDTFAPLGPFIVPKSFVQNPQKLKQQFILNGKVMQDSNTDRMTHNIMEMVSFASHIITLRPGDVLAMGSPAGVGTARATPIYFKPGDKAVCAIEGIGTLTNPVVAAPTGTSSSQ